MHCHEGDPSLPQYKLTLTAHDFDAARTASGILGEMAEPLALAVTSFEAQPAGYLVEAYYEQSPDVALIAEALAEVPGKRLGALQIAIVPDENWVTISQAALPPVEAGRFVVHGSHDRERVGFRLSALEVEAGEAFGTAHHATTQGCLIALDRLTRRRAFKRVLDLGCGSGVLAIAAARALPSAHIIASDIDPIATDVARANARLNRAGGRIAFATAVGLDHPVLRRGAPYDLVLANILAGPLIKIAPHLWPAIARGGVAVLSGLLVTQAPQVIAAYLAAGFYLIKRQDIAGWSTLTLTRR
jgi:ribosomal protein L11 methyltransferase